jgi:transposase
LVFIDESGFLLQPLRRRVWAPQGRTPLQRASDRRDRITTIAAITRAPWALRLGLYYELLDHNARTADFVQFVQQLHAHLRRPVILVWDRLSAHRSAARELLASANSWLQLEWLPAYAPDLDPVEHVWNQAKYGSLANVVPDDVHDLHSALDNILNSFRHQPNRLHSFFKAAQLTL